MTLTIKMLTQTLNQSPEIVFLALTDHESQKGDRKSSSKSLGHVSSSKAKSGGINSKNPGSNCAKSCDNCDECQRGEECPQNSISYSVSYFTWSVSDQSSDEECEQITITLDRMKLRKTSRERNGSIRDRCNDPES